MLCRWLALIAIALAAALAPSASGATIEIFNAWWSNSSDDDQDGCYAPDTPGTGLRLNWDVDLFGVPSTNVFEKVFLRNLGATEWVLITTTELHEVSGSTTTDAVWLELPPAANCNAREYRIEVYAEGTATPAAVCDPAIDSDLSQHKEEAYEDDMPAAKVYSTRWTQVADKDADGCMAPESPGNALRLYWDADVVGTGSLSVYERIYSRAVGSDKWTLRSTTTPHVIVANSPADEQYLELAPGESCSAIEYQIELYREGMLVPDYVRDASNDSNLAGRPEETFTQDTGPVIADAWWSNVADRSGDGCVAPATAGGLLRLHWDPNVAGGGTLLVFEKIYSRAEGSAEWALLRTTENHTITGALASDAQHLDIIPAGGCLTNDYRIEVYRADGSVPDAVRDDTNDADLRDRREQTFAEDNSQALLRDAWWQDVADQDGDGCMAPGTNSYMRLVWDADVSGASSLAVFERIYWRSAGGTEWTLATETAPHLIAGATPDDAQFLLMSPGSGCSAYDYRIEVFRIGNPTPDAVRDAGNDNDLAGHREELWAQDNLLGTIADAWWASFKDDDLDGCAAPIEEAAPLRLNWNTDIINGQAAMVYERVYSRATGTEEWTLLHITEPREVQGISNSDVVGIDIAPGTDCAATDYMIEVYREGALGADAARNPTNDVDLAQHRKESLAQDVPVASIASLWWSDTADLDGDGCVAPATLDGTLSLNWDPDLAGVGNVLVYEVVSWRASALADWEPIATNAVHALTRGETNDLQALALPPRGACSPGDYRIEIFREGQALADAVRDPANDPALSAVRQENYTDDNVVALVVDAWWTQMADADADGCDAPNLPDARPRLNWSMRLSGDGRQTVFEVISARAAGETNWTALATNAVHALTNQVIASVWAEFAPVSGCSPRDFRIEVYQVGRETPEFSVDGMTDPDLFARRQELYSEDNLVAVLANTWWSNNSDADQDGCEAPPALGQYLKLNWDADVLGSGTLTVIEKVYWKLSPNTDWTLLHTGAPRLISGSTAGDVQQVDIDPRTGCALVDYRIEIYRVGNSFPDQVRDSTNDSNLAAHKEETFIEDTQVTRATVTTSWWSGIIDNDEDGCVAPSTPNGFLRLNWDPEVAGNGSLTVYEKVYWRAGGVSVWSLLTTTSPHTITAGETTDSQTADLFGGSSCSTNEYKIEIYRVGSSIPDYARDPSTDPGLAHREESYAEDAGLPPTIVTPPADQRVSPGGTATFTVVAQGTGALSYQWFFQATNMLPGAVEATLSLRKVQESEAGEYFVVVSNNAGSVTSTVARLTVQDASPVRLESAAATLSGGFQFTISGPVGGVVIVEDSADLASWTPVATITNTSGNEIFTDPAATNRTRFFRLRPTP